MTKTSFLQKIGLSNHEAVIYEGLVELGSGTVAAIAAHASISRPVVYKCLPQLIAKGLVSTSIIGKRTLYSAESPAYLKNLFRSLEQDFNALLPHLMHTYSRSANKPVIRFYEGKKGIAQVYEDVVMSCTKDGLLYRYESPKDYKKNKKYYPLLYTKKLGGEHSEIEKCTITNEKTHRLRRPQLERLSKAIPAAFDAFEYDITELIYAHKVAFIDYQKETATIMENPSFARFQTKLFKLLFEKL